MLNDIEHYFDELFSAYSLKDIEENIFKREYRVRVFFHGANFRSDHKDGLVIKLIPKK